MNPKPLVSVIVATYRRNESLRMSLLSILNQTYDNFEIIVVDDNDDMDWNEKTRIIVDEIAKKTEKTIVRLENHPNLGSAKTRNRGIEKALGMYVTFLDDDDIYLPEKIEMQVTGMMKDNADYSLTDLVLLNEDGSVSEHRIRRYLKTSESKDLLLCHLKYHMTGTDTMMFKKTYLNQIGMFEPIDVGDEFYLMTKAIINNGVFTYVPSTDVEAYVHKGVAGLSSGNSKILGEMALFHHKQQFWDRISRNDQRYIVMRHHAVLAFAYLRSDNKKAFFLEGLRSFFSSPLSCLRLLKDLK